jgi:hypothetical protein
MARCTAPVRGHHSAEAQAACPACRYKRYGGGYSSYSPPSQSYYSAPSYSTPSSSSGGSRSSGGGSGRSVKPRWSRGGSSVLYTPTEVRALTPVRENVEKRAAAQPDLRDVFLCHAWDDRAGAAKELHDLLESLGVKVWFSEKDAVLGTPLMRAIDKGLVHSRIGVVLVTPSLLRRLKAEGVADKELSALLVREMLVPIVHNTTFEELNEVSPLLASRGGLNTTEETMRDVATKIAELVAV